MNPARRAILIIVVAAAVGVAGAGPAATSACAADAARVVVRDQAGVARNICVELPSEAVDSVEVLRRAGFDVVTHDYGGSLGEAVCSLDGQGTAVGDCPSASGHWHLWLYAGGSWREAIEGASSTEARPGAVQGWTWQEPGANTPPPAPSATCEQAAGAPPPPARSEESSSDTLVPGLIAAAAGAGVIFAVRRRRATP